MPPSSKWYRKISRRQFLQGTAAAGGAALATGLYTWRVEPHWLQIVERPLPVVDLPSSLEGARLVQLSDLHIGPQVDDSYLLGVFERIRALRPEIVVYTGDFVSYSADIGQHASRMFTHLPLGTRATFGILGNHDYGPHWSRPEVAAEIASLAQSAGVQMLRNEIAEVEGLQVVGLDDIWARKFDPRQAFSGVDPSRAAIALSHNPDTADEPGWEKHTGWILAGHTHGGQCKPPFLPPPILPVKNRLYTSGEFELSGGRRMYINRGIGHLLQVRFNARPEATVFQLTTVKV